ncbi:MAG: hypothetical protein ACPL7O_02075 [Armatimonadota bacterium]
MGRNRFIEFITVLIFAIGAGVATTLAVFHLEGTTRIVALIAIGAASIVSWSYLRKHFGRNV